MKNINEANTLAKIASLGIGLFSTAARADSTENLEGTTLNPIWSNSKQAGSVVYPRTSHAHSGSRSEDLVSTNSRLGKRILRWTRLKTMNILLAIAVMGLFDFTTNAQSWLTNGLVAYYPLDGNANDASGNGNNGVMTNTTTAANRFGDSGKAFYFNSTNSYIDIGAVLSQIQGLSAATFSLWFMINSNQVDGALFGDWVMSPVIGNNFGILILLRQGSIVVANDSGYGGIQTAQTSAPAQWHNICVVFDGSQTQSTNRVRLFLDGSPVQSTTYGDFRGFFGTIGNGTGAYLGRRALSFNYGDYYNGFLDDVRIYNRILSTNEVAQLYAYEASVLPIVKFVKAYTLDYSNLVVGSNYQLQASSDLVTWTNSGSLFTATSSTYTNTSYQRIFDWNQLFFRLQQL
jgi:Concanavalin A-like lectin/glucanases superfamily